MELQYSHVPKTVFHLKKGMIEGMEVTNKTLHLNPMEKYDENFTMMYMLENIGCLSTFYMLVMPLTADCKPLMVDTGLPL